MGLVFKSCFDKLHNEPPTPGARRLMMAALYAAHGMHTTLSFDVSVRYLCSFHGSARSLAPMSPLRSPARIGVSLRNLPATCQSEGRLQR